MSPLRPAAQYLPPLLLALLIQVDVAQAFTTIDYPGSVNSRAYGIDGATIVGWQQPVMSPGVFPSGYRYDGAFSGLQFPGSRSTTPRDVSGNRVAGYYQNGSTFLDESFVYDNGSWTALNNPSYTYTYAEGIDGNKVVGWMTSGPGSAAGFVYDGNWTTVSYPGSTSTRLYGIDGQNLVGTYVDSSFKSHGFRYDGSNWTPIDFPGGNATEPHAISGNNIVGSYVDPGGVTRGFRYDGRFWNTLHVPPEFTSSSNNGIDGQTIVGEYTTGGVTHGFSTPVASDPLTEYKFAIRGQVTSVTDAANRLQGAFHVGDAVDGQYNYFDGRYTNGIDFNGEFSQFQYFFGLGGTNYSAVDPAPVSMQLKINDQTFESGRNSTSSFDYLLQVTNDASGSSGLGLPGDRYSLQSQLQIPASLSNVPNATLLTTFALYDATGTALSSIDFPVSTPDVSKFASRIGRITLRDKFTFELLASIEYRIDEIAAVPEPSSGTLAFLGTVLAGLLMVRPSRWERQHGTPQAPLLLLHAVIGTY